jgi:hypothetical protein
MILINERTDLISQPTLWNCPPVAILVFYPPTDMHNLRYPNRGRLSIENCPILDCTPDLLASATDYENPPSKFAVSQSEEDLERPRRHFALNMFRQSIVAEVLLRGLVRCDNGELRLPEKGSVTTKAIDAISKSTLRIL